MADSEHVSVMLSEVLSTFDHLGAGAIIIDGTWGRGGHSRALLARLPEDVRLIAMDWDVTAIENAHAVAAVDPRLRVHRRAFAELAEVARAEQVLGAVDAVLLDLGVSSPHFDDPARGFSFRLDGPLDMRMDQSRTTTAAALIAEASADELADIFKRYGDERYAKRIAAAIVAVRVETPIRRTLALAQVVTDAHPRWPRDQHPATRVFQALRLAVNDEPGQLEAALAALPEVLAIGGRAAVLSFHSGEDRVVKRAFRGVIQEPRVARMPQVGPGRPLRVRGKAQRASVAEATRNPRARSAVLRVAERVA